MSGNWAKPQTAPACPEQTSAEREEYLRHGLREVRCDRCAAVVLAAKRSPTHTSVQWDAASQRTCPALAEHPRSGCPWLHASIDAAAAEGHFEGVSV